MCVGVCLMIMKMIFLFTLNVCVCVVKRGLNNHDDKEMEFCLFVCIGELSRIE